MMSNNLLVNGSFELGPTTPDSPSFVPLFPGSTDIFGWDIIRGGIDYEAEWRIGTDGWMSADGDYSLDLNGTPGVGGVAQTFNTKVGQKYLVTFDLAAHPSGLLQTMRVSAAGQSADFYFQSKSDPSNLGWQALTWEFTAISRQTTLELYSLQTGYQFGGPALDGVVVTAINQINDTKGKNKLVGTAGTDELNGLNGKDTLIGMAGNDILNGGNGADILIGVDPKAIEAQHSNCTQLLSPGGSPIYNPSNGHYYEFVAATNIPWTSAKTAASSRTFNGLQGYLVTITSQAEDDFLHLNFNTLSNVWIGASDATQEGLWKWETGPEEGLAFWLGRFNGSPINGAYEDWDGGEPSNRVASTGEEEDFAVWNHRIEGGSVRFGWNDLPNIPPSIIEPDSSVPGYFVEYSGSIISKSPEIDILTGGKGSDTFVLGDINNIYYDDGNPNTQGLLDYALITDFSNEDIIQLNGKANKYLLDETYSLGGSAGTAIFYKDTINELIGFVEGVTGLNLKSNDFSFTGCL